MRYDIKGDNMQMLNIEIDPSDHMYSVAGAMTYMTGNVTMEARARQGAWSSIKRMFTGASLFLMEYKTSGSGVIGLSADAPGKIMDLDISRGTWLVQKTGFLAAEGGVSMELAFQKKLSTMLFGGEGLIIQKVFGSGIAFIKGCGDFIVKDLGPGEVLKVSTSNAVAWEESVKYEISSTGGIKNALFSGEGFFLTVLKGPGRVVLQSMTLGDMAMALYPYMPSSSSRGDEYGEEA